MKIEITSKMNHSAGKKEYSLYVNGEQIENLKGTEQLQNKVNNLINAWFK